MTWNTCKFETCENWTYRPDVDYCETHRRTIVKSQQTERGMKEKKAIMIEKAKKKLPNKVSPKREELNKEYFKLVEQFKKDNPNCHAKIENICTGETEDPHHSRGRGKYLLDVSTWIPVCRNCHIYIEQHPHDANRRNLSFSKLATEKQTI